MPAMKNKFHAAAKLSRTALAVSASTRIAARTKPERSAVQIYEDRRNGKSYATNAVDKVYARRAQPGTRNHRTSTR